MRIEGNYTTRAISLPDAAWAYLEDIRKAGASVEDVIVALIFLEQERRGRPTSSDRLA